MAVEAIFWFHPLVWWLGARLMEEREHACDEEVLREGQRAPNIRRSHPQNLRALPGIAAALHLRDHRRESQKTHRDNHGQSRRAQSQSYQRNNPRSGRDSNSRHPHRRRHPQRPHTYRGSTSAPSHATSACIHFEIQICLHQTLPTRPSRPIPIQVSSRHHQAR